MVAGDGDGLAVGRELEGGDDGGLEIDGGARFGGIGGRIVLGAGSDPIAEEGDVCFGEGRLGEGW